MFWRRVRVLRVLGLVLRVFAAFGGSLDRVLGNAAQFLLLTVALTCSNLNTPIFTLIFTLKRNL